MLAACDNQYYSCNGIGTLNLLDSYKLNSITQATALLQLLNALTLRFR